MPWKRQSSNGLNRILQLGLQITKTDSSASSHLILLTTLRARQGRLLWDISVKLTHQCQLVLLFLFFHISCQTGSKGWDKPCQGPYQAALKPTCFIHPRSCLQRVPTSLYSPPVPGMEQVGQRGDDWLSDISLVIRSEGTELFRQECSGIHEQ